MTILILDPSGDLLPPYATWLRDLGEDLVVYTAARDTVDDRADYADVRRFADYGRSAAIENAALHLAAQRTISAIVATGDADLIRAGALRDYLGIAGMGRASAVALRDLVDMRERLEQAGVGVVAVGPVERAADVYRYAHAWGYPVRIRRRRLSRWPTVALLADEDDANAYTDGGLGGYPGTVPSLVAEPCVEGERHHTVGATPELDELSAAAVSALWSQATGRFQVELVRTRDGRMLVDAIGFADRDSEGAHRELARTQAGSGLAKVAP